MLMRHLLSHEDIQWATEQSDFVAKILGEEAKEKYLSFKQIVADRSPRELGTVV